MPIRKINAQQFDWQNAARILSVGFAEIDMKQQKFKQIRKQMWFSSGKIHYNQIHNSQLYVLSCKY